MGPTQLDNISLSEVFPTHQLLFFPFFFNPTGEIKLDMPTLNIEGDASELASDQEVVETLESLANGWLVLIVSANEELQRKVPQVIGFKMACQSHLP